MTEQASKYKYSVALGAHDSRLKKGPAKVVVDTFYARWLDATLPVFAKLIEYNLAHVAELCDKNVVSRSDAASIIETLRWIEQMGVGHFEFDPHLEDTMPNIEAILVSKLGEEVGGRVLTGRARGEVTAVAMRLHLRENVLGLMTELNELRRVVLNLAKDHAETVMPGYTHAQHAQPTTLGHYLACIAEVLETDFSRFEDSYKRLNVSPAESGIGQGTAYPIDRERISRLLGFVGLIENTRYALLSWDRTLEMQSNASILALNLNRFSDDLFYWCTYEFGMVELSDEYSATSYIMPQKKNPYVLEELACIPGRVISAFTREAFRWNRVSFGLATHIGGVKIDPSEAIIEVRGALKMLAGVVESLKVNAELMKERSGIFFTQASELADTLVREKGLSFRTAHKIMGTVVRIAIAENRKPSEIDAKMIDAASIEVTGKPLDLPSDVLARALDAMQIIRARKVIGGTAPEAVRMSLGNRHAKLEEDSRSLDAKCVHITHARAELERTLDLITE